MPKIPLIDWFVLAWFASCWVGYTYFARRKSGEIPSLVVSMRIYRREWFLHVLGRDNRIADIAALNALLTGATFFASTSLLILGGLSANGERWVHCRPGFFLPVRVLSRLFRRRFLEALAAAHHGGRLQFFGEDAGLRDPRVFAQWLAPLRTCEWVVYAKRPFAGPAAVLAYLSRYTHRVAISNSRLLAFDERGVTFRWKDYRATGKTRYKTMTLSADEFMRRFLLHVLPSGFHRIRHYGLLGSAGRREHLACARELLHVVPVAEPPSTEAPVANVQPTFICPHCGAAMSIIEIFARGQPIRAPPTLRAAA